MSDQRKKPICVLAGNRRQYENYLLEKGLTRHEAIYADSPERLRGCEFSEIHVVGTARNCTGYWELQEMAKAMVR